MNIIKLQVMFEWSLEWDCRGQISLPTGMGGKLKNPSSCTVHENMVLFTSFINYKSLLDNHCSFYFPFENCLNGEGKQNIFFVSWRNSLE